MTGYKAVARTGKTRRTTARRCTGWHMERTLPLQTHIMIMIREPKD
jgi:hypothetical protein